MYESRYLRLNQTLDSHYVDLITYFMLATPSTRVNTVYSIPLTFYIIQKFMSMSILYNFK
ncbi:hypothetical protein GCM10008917_10950 [Paraclostridium tenue]|uniref:Uncharacterized protein n=1 Tax=Paraclostridium tenue TaxID=1737 RepID=A0ABP3XBN6_9FIRM